MFDTMTLTKTLGALFGALLIFLLVNWGASTVYGLSEESHDERAAAYAIDTGAADAAAAPADAGPPFEEILASADAAAGQKVFAKCAACHKIDGANGTGPHLNGVVGRPVASVSDFSYSSVLAGHGGDWTPDALNEWLTSPKAYAPGTKMAFAGIPKVEDRANLIAYLETVK